MRNTIITIVLLLFCITNTTAQSKYITDIKTVKELKRRLQKESVYDVLTSINFEYADSKKNWEEIHNDTLLKKQLLKLFDQKVYFDYYMNKQIKEFKDLMNDKKFSDDEVETYLNKRNREKQYDSIRRNSLSYEKYKDSIIADRIKLYKAQENPENHYPDGICIATIASAHYLEAYAITKQWWIKKGRSTYYTNPLFGSLLQYNDPEAQDLLTQKIDEFIRTNGKSGSPIAIQGSLTVRNSYSLKQLFRLLTVTEDNPGFPGEPPTPFNCDMMDVIISRLQNEGGYTFPEENMEPRGRYGDKKDCENKFKHLPLAKKYAEEYYIRLDKEQEYWMKNMPFYKGK